MSRLAGLVGSLYVSRLPVRPSPARTARDTAAESSPRRRVAPGERSFDDEFCERFEELFASLFRYLDRLTGDAALASDIAQDALVRLYERGSAPDDVRAWLVTVAHNRLRTVQRQERRRAVLLSLHAALVPGGREAPATPDVATEVDERRAAVRTALEALTPRERRLLLLRSEGFSYREIARALGVSETSVGTFLSRAKVAFVRAVRGDARASD